MLFTHETRTDLPGCPDNMETEKQCVAANCKYDAREHTVYCTCDKTQHNTHVRQQAKHNN